MHESTKPGRHRPDRTWLEREERVLDLVRRAGFLPLLEGGTWVVYDLHGREVTTCLDAPDMEAWLTAHLADGGGGASGFGALLP